LTKQTQTINTTAEYETASVVAGKKLVTVIYAIAAKELSIQIADISYL
jgi:hypothetical protein